QKVRKPSAVMTGGRMNGATPRSRNTLAQGAMRRQRNQESGSAIRTASAAEAAASVTELIRAARQLSSVKICWYQLNEKPCGGKVRACFSLTETPATTTSGAARNIPTNVKIIRRRAVALMLPLPCVLRPEA